METSVAQGDDHVVKSRLCDAGRRKRVVSQRATMSDLKSFLLAPLDQWHRSLFRAVNTAITRDSRTHLMWRCTVTLGWTIDVLRWASAEERPRWKAVIWRGSGCTSGRVLAVGGGERKQARACRD